MTSLKITGFLTLAAFIGVFIYQNTEVMQLKFLFWSVTMSACLMLLLTLFTGMSMGILLSFLNVRRKAKKIHTSI